jgi:hypothetical protein
MSDERAKRWVEESQRDATRQSAGKMHLQAAAKAERAGDVAAMERELAAAAQAFIQSAGEYRASKSFKTAALNMCDAGDVYSELAGASKAIAAYQQGADDLLAASAEHLMWGDDAETNKGVTLAVTASMIYIMIGKEADAFYKARGFAAENASKIRLPAVIRLSQIPQMLENSIQALNLDSFAEAENAAVTELKSALASSSSSEFCKYVDKGLEMVREILRGKLKVPKISSQLTIPIDLTFTEDFSVHLNIRNTGEGAASNMKIEWHLDDGLQFVSGERTKTIPHLPAGENLKIAVILRGAEALGGTRDYSVVVRGSYEDKLKTVYSLQAGPTVITLKDFKESEKLLQDSDVTSGRVGFLRASIEESEFEVEPLLRIIDGLTSSLKESRAEVEKGELDAAKARIRVVNDIVDQIDALVGDEALAERVADTKLTEKKKFAISKIVPAFEEAITYALNQEKKIEAEVPLALTEWDSLTEKKKRILTAATKIKTIANDVKGKLASPEHQLLQNSISDLQMEAEKILIDSLLVVGERPASPEKVEMALVVARSIRNEITQLLESKKSDLK